MKVIVAKNSGFCFGVKNAVKIAEENAASDTYSFGQIIHNEYVVKKLEKKGLKAVDSVSEIPQNSKVIIRSHGVGKSVYIQLQNKNIQIVDATCVFVKRIHQIVEKHFLDGFQIVIIGEKTHPEVVGINGWCENSAIIINDDFDLENLKKYQKLCFVCQTTYSAEKYSKIIKKLSKHQFNLLEIFDTICYTTNERQIEAKKLAEQSDIVLVVGSLNSSNTTKLFEVCKQACENTYHLQSVAEINKIKTKPTDTIGIVAGASTPEELIMEVKSYMSQQYSEVQDQEFIAGVEESLVSYKEGKRVKGTVINVDETGIHLNIGGKKDGLIPKNEVSVDGSYNAASFAVGSELEAIIIAKQDPESGCVLLSKKKVDLIKEGDKFVETIRGGEVFELVMDKETKGGLLGKIGTYTVFVPASQVKESFVKDLGVFVGKKLKLTALEIDDNKHKIVASARKVIETARKEREEIFWSHVQPDVIVNGKVKRITNFGAFVSVDNFDCLAHIVDLSWTHIKSVEEVLTIGQNYDFVVLSVDKEKGRVSLGYKQLQPHPFVKCMEEHPIGSITKGKVVSIVPFGAFVEIAPNIEGLVHVSEAAHTFVKDINDILKIGDIIDVMITNADEASKKITLSIKACTKEEPREEAATEYIDNADNDKTEKMERPDRKDRFEKKYAPVKKVKEMKEPEGQKEWSEESSNNPFAALLKNLDVDNKDEQ